MRPTFVAPTALILVVWTSAAMAQSFIEFPVPTPASQPNGIVTASDGNMWFTEIAGNKIGRITPAGDIKEYDLPVNGLGQSSQPIAIVEGPDRALYFTMSNASHIGRITTAGDLSFFPTPTAMSGPEGIAVGPERAIWFTEITANKIGRLTPGAVPAIVEFPIPTGNSRPARIAYAPDGNLWFTESQTSPQVNQIGRITPAGVITEFPITTTAASQPWSIKGQNFSGSAVLFTERAAGKIGLMSTTGQMLQEFPIPTPNSQPVRAIDGPDGGIWITEFAGNNLLRLTGGGMIEFAVPTPASEPSGITVGSDGALWFTEQAGNKIGRFQPTSSQTHLFASILPSGRSIQIGKAATVFATMINAGPNDAHQCKVSPISFVPLQTASYQTTDPNTNLPIGFVNTPVDIPATKLQTFVLSLTPSAPQPPIDMRIGFSCDDANAAPILPGVDTVLISASSNPTPDVVALAATVTGNGVVNIPGTSGIGAFSVATVNVGSGASITASANTGGAVLPVTIKMCQSNPLTGQCLAPCESLCPSVTAQINANDTPTFSVFVFGNGQVPFQPGVNRVFVQFADTNGIVRGSTSVAAQTSAP